MVRTQLSEVKIYRHGNYTVSGFSNHINGFPAGASVEEEAVDDLLPLLSPFALVHNKGSVSSFIYLFSHFLYRTPTIEHQAPSDKRSPPPVPTTPAHSSFSRNFHLLARSFFSLFFTLCPFFLVGTLLILNMCVCLPFSHSFSNSI